jgi:HAE1 family hydrophobic/amphiphilic exporter-1
MWDILQTMQTYFGDSQASDLTDSENTTSNGANRRRIKQRVIVMNGICQKKQIGWNGSCGNISKIKTYKWFRNSFEIQPFNGLNAIAKPGFSSGAAIQAVQEVADTKLPKGYTILRFN